MDSIVFDIIDCYGGTKIIKLTSNARFPAVSKCVRVICFFLSSQLKKPADSQLLWPSKRPAYALVCTMTLRMAVG